MKGLALLVAAGLTMAGLAGCGSGGDHSHYTPDAVSYGTPVSQPSFGRLVAAIRQETGSTQVVSLTSEVRGYAEYDVEVGGEKPRRFSYDYTYAKLDKPYISDAYVDPDAATFDLAKLDLAVIEKVHHRAWDDASRRIASTETTITAPTTPGGPAIRVVVTGVDDSAYVLDANLAGKVLSEGPADQ
ncbi:hypothetical protein [Nocardioides montaniterrae]